MKIDKFELWLGLLNFGLGIMNLILSSINNRGLAFFLSVLILMGGCFNIVNSIKDKKCK